MLPIRLRNDRDVITNDIYRRNQQKSDVMRCKRGIFEVYLGFTYFVTLPIGRLPKNRTLKRKPEVLIVKLNKHRRKHWGLYATTTARQRKRHLKIQVRVTFTTLRLFQFVQLLPM